jgi:5-methyltetrahydrofolate--homocysteine methyltransferase
MQKHAINKEYIMSIMKKVREHGLFLDGAMGSMLISAGLQGGLVPEAWLLERPDEISEVHRQYKEAGAEVLTTATFGGNDISLEKAGLGRQMELINSTAVVLAKRIADDDCFVAGNIGPTGELLSPAGLLTVDKAKHSFADQANVLADSGVDLFLVQTFYDLQELLAAVEGIKAVCDVPIFATMSFQEKKSRFVTIMGNRVEESMKTLQDAGVSVVGANCSIASSAMVRLAKELRSVTSAPVLVQPNAGVPQLENGIAVYNESPDSFAQNIKEIKSLGIEVVGGCCGTTPEHIKAMVDLNR